MQKLNFTEFKAHFLLLPPLQQAGYFLWPSFASDKLSVNEIKLLKSIKPSGVILFKRNLTTTEQSKSFVDEIKSIVIEKNNPIDKDFIVSIDEEGGRVSRLPVPNIKGKCAFEFAENKDEEGLKKQILLQCHHASVIGINCLLAPVADILTESQNTVMGDRCFGKDPQTVSHYASIVNEAILSQKLYSCAKHFPGHGNTTTDSHKEISVSLVTLEKLKNREWLPFQVLIKNNVPFIMAAHVLVPKIDAKYPATLSYKILTQQLKEELHFDGLILSDDLRMNAIAIHYNNTTKSQESFIEDGPVNSQNQSGEEDEYLKSAAIDALNAGCDILLSCQSIEKEEIIAKEIAQKCQEDNKFLENILLKAYKIYEKLN